MYVNTETSDSIILRYLAMNNEDDNTVSFHTTKKKSLGDLMDYLLPSADIKDVDTLPEGGYNVVVEFESHKDKMDFGWLFATTEMRTRENHLRRYREQKENAVF